MKYNLIKFALILGLLQLNACCCGGGLWNDQRASTTSTEFVPGDGLLEDFHNSVNVFDH